MEPVFRIRIQMYCKWVSFQIGNYKPDLDSGRPIFLAPFCLWDFLLMCSNLLKWDTVLNFQLTQCSRCTFLSCFSINTGTKRD